MPNKRANGEGTIYKLTNGRWRVSVSHIDADGKPRRRSRKVKTQADARIVLEELRGNIAAGINLDSGRQTLKAFLDHWHKVEIIPNRAENTAKSYRNAIDKHIVPALGSIQLRKLTPGQIVSALARMDQQGTGNRSRQNAFVVLSAALSQAVAWSELTSNPAAKVGKPKADREEIRPLTLEESKRFLQTCRGYLHEALYLLAITTGMRQGELFGLHWDAIDFAGRKLIVRQQATDIWGAVKIKPPKSKASIRTIDLTNQAITALQEQQEYLHSQGQGTCQIVFPNEVGGYLRRGSFTRWSWSPLLTAADIDHRGFHHLRHTAATLMLNAGVPIQVVSHILGHASPAVTLKIYAHVLPGLEIQAADKVSQLLT